MPPTKPRTTPPANPLTRSSSCKTFTGATDGLPQSGRPIQRRTGRRRAPGTQANASCRHDPSGRSCGARRTGCAPTRRCGHPIDFDSRQLWTNFALPRNTSRASPVVTCSSNRRKSSRVTGSVDAEGSGDGLADGSGDESAGEGDADGDGDEQAGSSGVTVQSTAHAVPGVRATAQDANSVSTPREAHVMPPQRSRRTAAGRSWCTG